MRSDLQHWVSRGVNDQIACLHLMFAEVINDCCPRIRRIADDFTSRERFDLLQQFIGKPIGKYAERFLDIQAHDLPVPRHRIFPNRNFFQFGCIPIMVSYRLHAF